MSAPLVYVLVLTYNHYEDTRVALTSLGAMTYPNFRVLVVDNGSTDATLDRLPSEFPEVDLHRNGKNLGFAAGVNVGLRFAIDAGAHLVLVMNNDVRVAPDLLESLVSAVVPGIGALAPMIYQMEDETRIWSSGFKRHPWLLEMRGGARGQPDVGRTRDPCEVDYLLGCVLLLPVPVLQDVGLFDERYFFYYEDLDMSTRIQARGYRLLVVPDARVWHRGAASAGFGSPFHVYQMARSSVIFFSHYAPGWLRVPVAFHRLASSLRKTLTFAARGRWDLVGQHWRGIRDGWRA